jgi:hypothetical protein
MTQDMPGGWDAAAPDTEVVECRSTVASGEALASRPPGALVDLSFCACPYI